MRQGQGCWGAGPSLLTLLHHLASGCESILARLPHTTSSAQRCDGGPVGHPRYSALLGPVLLLVPKFDTSHTVTKQSQAPPSLLMGVLLLEGAPRHTPPPTAPPPAACLFPPCPPPTAQCVPLRPWPVPLSASTSPPHPQCRQPGSLLLGCAGPAKPPRSPRTPPTLTGPWAPRQPPLLCRWWGCSSCGFFWLVALPGQPLRTLRSLWVTTGVPASPFWVKLLQVLG